MIVTMSRVLFLRCRRENGGLNGGIFKIDIIIECLDYGSQYFNISTYIIFCYK